MGFLKKIQFMMIKSICMKSCRSMSFCFDELEKRFPESDVKNLLVATLLRKKDWKQIDNFSFEYKNFDKLTIKDDHNLEKIIKDTLWIELKNAILSYADEKIAKELMLKTVSFFFDKRCKKIH